MLRSLPVPTAGAHERERWGDVLRGALILLVVLWHVVMKTYLQIDWRLGVPVPGVWGVTGDVVWTFLMPAFLFVSGHFAAPAVRRPWRSVLAPRVLRYAYLYLLWSLVHAAALWAFPDFPTIVPRTLAELVEDLTISPQDTWYLYALALYFVVTKALVRVPAWIVVGASGVLSAAVGAGWIEIVGNRGSLLSNLVFFVLGAHLAPIVSRAAARVAMPVVAACVVGFLVAFAAMRFAHAEQVPGVRPTMSAVGVLTVVAVASAVARSVRMGGALVWIGRRTLPVYLVHMPLLAVADVVLVRWISDAGRAVQLAAAVTLPVVLTAALVVLSLVLGRLLSGRGLGWLWDLPRRGRAPAAGVRRPVLVRAVSVVVLLVACGAVAVRVTAIPGCGADAPRVPADRPGEVSIGAAGDVLVYDVAHTVPEDRGLGHLDAVRPWFTDDLVTGNIEQVISPDTGFDKCSDRADCLAFRSDPDVASALAGFDVMTMANNHTGDFGPVGYENTRRALAAEGVRAVGARDEIVCTRIGDTTVAMIGFAPYGGTNRVTDLRHVRDLVRAARMTADVVVVQAHMGAEGPTANVVRPGKEVMFGEDRGDPVAFAHAAVDAGADLVLGHGPHSLRGMESYRGRLIAYSLGNFGGGGVFGAEPETRYGAYLSVRLSEDGRLLGGTVRSVRFAESVGRPEPDPDDGAARLIDRFGARDLGDSAVRLGANGTIVVSR